MASRQCLTFGATESIASPGQTTSLDVNDCSCGPSRCKSDVAAMYKIYI
jgi:hypothetical protein